MNDKDLAQKRADLSDKLQLITELQQEAAELAAEINAEEQARKDLPGTVFPFRPQPSNESDRQQGSQ